MSNKGTDWLRRKAGLKEFWKDDELKARLASGRNQLRIKQASKQTLAAIERSPVRRTRGQGAASIPWYLDEDAAFDQLDRLPVEKTFDFGGDWAWSSVSESYEFDFTPWHRRVDELYYEELEDWDLAPLRPRARHLGDDEWEPDRWFPDEDVTDREVQP